MTTTDAGSADAGLILVKIELPLGGRTFRAELRVPEGPTRAGDLLPLFHALADHLLQASGEASEARGQPVTCARGCAACCRHLVPTSEVEARRLHALIEHLPEERRTVVRRRIDAGLARLRESGWMNRMERFDELWDAGLVELIHDYFRLWIDCPFLDGEQCSIHAQRPAACREHCVTSAPRLCSAPGEEGVERLRMPPEVVSRALRCFNVTDGFGVKQWWPLLLALDWARSQPPEAVQGTGPELLQRFFERLVGNTAGRGTR